MLIDPNQTTEKPTPSAMLIKALEVFGAHEPDAAVLLFTTPQGEIGIISCCSNKFEAIGIVEAGSILLRSGVAASASNAQRIE